MPSHIFGLIVSRLFSLHTSGWQLGCQDDIQSPTLCSNHLTAGLFKYFKESGRLYEAASFFQGLFSEDLEVAAILAAAYIGCGTKE